MRTGTTISLPVLFMILLFPFPFATLSAQDEDYDPYASIDGITMQEVSRASKKHGLHWCAVPLVSYNEQLGLSGRLAGTLFDFGAGNHYPDYNQLLYAEAGYSSRQAGIFRAYYDTKTLLKDYKLDFDITYQPDALYDFYGMNGNQAYYDYLLSTPYYNANYYLHDNPNYISSAFYRMKRNYLRVAADIRGIIKDSLNLYWHAGLGMQYFNIGRIDVERYNKGLAPINQIADTITLYDLYRLWGLVAPEEAAGGFHPFLHAGVSIDNRDRMINPHRGFYGDLFLTGTLGIGNLSGYSNLKVNFNWKHHVTFWEDVVAFAYMVGGQLTVAGKSPFYQNGIINQLLSQRDMFEGIGADNLPRGMLRNRVLGKGFEYASVELRINVFHFRVGREQLVVSLNPFIDEMMILQPYDLTGYEDNPHFRTSRSAYMPHVTVGCGAKVTAGNAFVVSADWASPLHEQDNERLSNLYFTIGYLF